MKQRGFKPSPTIWNSMLAAYANGVKVEHAEKVIEQMQAQGIILGSASWVWLIMAYFKARRPQMAMRRVAELLPQTEDDNVVLTEGQFMGLLTQMINAELFPEATQLIQARNKSGSSLSMAALDLFLQRFGTVKTLNLGAMADTLTHARRLGLTPSVFSLSHVLSGLLYSGCLDDAQQLLINMHQVGMKFSRLTYSKLIMYLVRCRGREEADIARRLLFETEGISPGKHHTLYAAIIEAYCHLSKDPNHAQEQATCLQIADDLFDRMRELDENPNQKIYGDLIDAHLAKQTDRDVEKALYYFKTFRSSRFHSKARNVQGTTVILWITVISGLVDAGRLNLAKEIIDLMKKDGYQVMPKHRKLLALTLTVERSTASQSNEEFD